MAAPMLPGRDEPIPTFRIDLSLPPAERYIQVATEMGERMQHLTGIFDEILGIFISWRWLRRVIQFLASGILRRVHSKEQQEELRGISKASGVSFFLLVALNVLLDALLGCTSGAAMTSVGKQTRGGPEPEKRMMHFRTLDWEMPGLRSVLVVLEFVRSDSKEPEKVIARSITYAGFVGVLTGVRKDLSVSLNFRPHHHSSMFKLRLHQMAVMLGIRPSICSVLRDVLFPDPYTATTRLADFLVTLSSIPSSPCYLFLCDGDQAVVLEKDLIGGEFHAAKDFLVHTNHDTPSDNPADDIKYQAEKLKILGMDILVEDSEDRRACVTKKWKVLKGRQERKWKESMQEGEMPVVVVREGTLKGWVRAFPTSNETTHYGCILDPKMGTIPFLERGEVVVIDEQILVSDDEGEKVAHNPVENPTRKASFDGSIATGEEVDRKVKTQDRNLARKTQLYVGIGPEGP